MTFIEWLEQTWVYIVAVIGGITLLWGFNKLLKEIRESIKAPITNIEKNVTDIKTKVEVQDEAIKSILRKDILNLSEKYIRKGYITVNQKKTLYELYKAYQEEGGNTFIDALMNDINDLQVKETSED